MNQWENQNHPENRIDEIEFWTPEKRLAVTETLRRDSEKSSGLLRRLAVTETLVEELRLMLE